MEIIQTHLGLEWQYAHQPALQFTPDAQEPVDSDIVVPPDLQIVQELYHLAMMGNLQGIEGKLELIAAIDPNLQPFVQKMKTLVSDFQIKQIKNLLQSYIPLKRAS